MLRSALAALLLLGLAAPASAGVRAVAELFTSQGCSSCPAADAYLAELARDPEIVALAYHVDYWDYLGWRDTFGSAEATRRQKAYAEARGDHAVYTPQMIVNGVGHLVGSHRGAISAALARAALPVPVALARTGEEMTITLGAGEAEPGRPATVRLVTYEPRGRVAVTSGENAGQTLEYVNVVREVRAVGMWKGQPVTITLPAAEVLGEGTLGCAVLLQAEENGPGRILGAAKLEPGR